MIGSAQPLVQKSLNNVALKQKAEKLKLYYKNSVKGPDTLRYQALFFKEFPEKFLYFQDLYGFKDTTVNILYHEAPEHLDLFNRINCVEDTLYYEKIINLAMNGKWEVDAVNYFQSGLRENFEKKPALAFTILSRKIDADIRNFWFFYFGARFPANMEIPLKFAPMEKDYPRVYTVMDKTLKEVKKRGRPLED